MPQRVPISPQWRMNFCATGVRAGIFFFSSFCQDRIYRHLCCVSRPIYEKPRPCGTYTFQRACGHSLGILAEVATRSWQALYGDKTGEMAVETNSGTSMWIIVPFPSSLEMSMR